MLASQNSQISLGKLKCTVLKHTNFMKGLATLVGEGISVPDTVFPDPKNVKDAL